MSGFTHSGGDNRGLPDNTERNNPIPSGAAAPGAEGSQPPRGSRFGAWLDKRKAKVERGMQKAERSVKSLLERGKPKNEEEGATSSSKVQAIAMGTFKAALEIAAALVPEPFKGAAKALLKVVNVIEVRASIIV